MRIIIEVSGRDEEATVQAYVESTYGRDHLNRLQLPPGMADRSLILRHIDQLLQRHGISSSEDNASPPAALPLPVPAQLVASSDDKSGGVS